MGRDERLLLEVEHPTGLASAVARAAILGCGEPHILGGTRALLRCVNSLGAANALSWTPGVSLLSYGEFVGPGSFRELSRALAGIISGILEDGDRIWMEVYGDGSTEFQDYLAGELVSSTHVELDHNRPSKLFTIFLVEGGAFLSHGYRRGIGGLPLGSEGSALSLFSGGRCGAEALVAAVRGGFRVRPLFLEMGNEAPPENIRRALMAAAIMVQKISPGGEVLAGYVPERAIGVLKGGEWIYHRFLAEVAGLVARKAGDRAIFVGMSPEPGYADVIDAYARAQRSLGVAFSVHQCGGFPMMPFDEELESLIDEHKWRLARPPHLGSVPAGLDETWRASGLPDIADEVAGSIVSMRAEGELARHEVLDGYLRARSHLKDLLDGGG
ncbi:MAG: hypothetical protein ACP5G6_02990 [Conexivisphaera sp.]|jgi:hypothetical protein|nr:hypothetical protein [Conexivisphaerales archaeon]